MRIGSVSHATPNVVARTQEVFTLMQGAIARFGGMLARFSVDDKGTVMFAAFGPPPAQHEDDAARAVICALEIQSSLQEMARLFREIAVGGLSLKRRYKGGTKKKCGRGGPHAVSLTPSRLPDNPRASFASCCARLFVLMHASRFWCSRQARDHTVRVGVTTGTVFAGSVGNAERGEYTFYGTTVNMAARLMTHEANSGILLDEHTYRDVQVRAQAIAGEGGRGAKCGRGFARDVRNF
eukprot:6176726-Pleurochrysis_carterae.AAC.2